MKIHLSSQTVSLLLIIVGAGLAALAYLHGNSDGVRGQMFTFAGGIVTGAFALLNSDKKSEAPPDVPPNTSLTQTTTLKTQTPPDASNAAVAPVSTEVLPR